MVEFSKEQLFVVTGASSGIGESVVLLLNDLGASVIAVARDENRLQALSFKAKYPERIFIEIKDLTENIQNLTVFIKLLREKYGKLNGMAYCAGVVPILPLSAMDMNIVQETFNINYFVPLFLSKGVCDKRNNIGSGTSLVFISSVAADLSDKGHLIYAGTKAALNASIRSIAKEYAKNKVRLNCVSPSNIKTFKTSQEYLNSQIDLYPMGFGEVNDVAKMVVFLLSDKASWITGQNYIVDCASF